MLLVSFTSLVSLSSRIEEHFRVTPFPPPPPLIPPPPSPSAPAAAVATDAPSLSPAPMPLRRSPPREYHEEAALWLSGVGEGGGESPPPSLKFLRNLLTPSSSSPQRVS